MARKKAAATPPKAAGRPSTADRLARVVGALLHALRPAWVLAVACVAYLGLVFVLEQAALAHGAARIARIDLEVRPAPASGLTRLTAPTAAAEFGRKQAEMRLNACLKQALGRNPRQDALIADLRAALVQEPGVQSLDQVQPLFPGILKVVVTARAPEMRLKGSGRALDGHGVLLPIEMGHLALPEYSRDSDPTGRTLAGRLDDSLYPVTVQAVRTLVDAWPALATDPQLTIQTVQVKEAGAPAELIVTLANGTRLEWGRLQENGDPAEQFARRRQALMAVQARHADPNNLRVVRLFDADAPVELRQPAAVEFRRGTPASRMALSATREPGR